MSDQADRIETLLIDTSTRLDQTNAYLAVVQDQLTLLLDAMAGESKQQPLDPSVWPDWYRDLYSLPNFKKTLEDCSQWLVEKNIGQEKADETASYIRSRWPGKGSRPWKQPWATFTNLVKKYPPGTQGPTRSVQVEGGKYVQEFEQRRGSAPQQ